MVGELQTFLMGTKSQHGHCVLDGASETEFGPIELQHACFDLGKIKDVAYELQECVRRIFDRAQIFHLLVIELGVEC